MIGLLNLNLNESLVFISDSLPAHVPQIIVNRELLHKRLVFDVELLGNCDDIISELCKRLGADWDHLAQPGPPAEEVHYSDISPAPAVPPADLPEVSVKGRQELLEHCADSGLGDFETVTSAVSSQESSVGSSSTVSMGKDYVSNTDRLERLSSSDSGVESNTTADIQGRVCLTLPLQSSGLSRAAVPSKHCAGDGVSSSVPVSEDGVHGKDSSCIEGSSQGDCVCSVSQQALGACKHTGHTAKQAQSPEVSRKHRESTHHTSHPSRCRRISEGCHVAEPHSTGDCSSPRRRRSSVSHSHCNEDGEKIDLDRESKKDNAHCSHTDTIEELRHTWVVSRRHSIASKVTGRL